MNPPSEQADIYAASVIENDKKREALNPDIMRNNLYTHVFDSDADIERSIRWLIEDYTRDGISPYVIDLGLEGSIETIAKDVVIGELIAKRAAIARAREWAGL